MTYTKLKVSIELDRYFDEILHIVSLTNMNIITMFYFYFKTMMIFPKTVDPRTSNIKFFLKSSQMPRLHQLNLKGDTSPTLSKLGLMLILNHWQISDIFEVSCFILKRDTNLAFYYIT